MYRCMKIAEFKAFNLVQKSSRSIECNKSYDRLHPGTTAQTSSQIPEGHKGSWVPHAWLHNDIFLLPDVPSS